MRLSCRAAVAIALLLAGSARAQSDPNDFTSTITTTPSTILQATQAGRSQIFLQVQGPAAVACRPGGTPSFAGGSIVLGGGAGTPAIGGSATLSGPLADPGAWQCMTYSGAETLVVRAYH